jgi:hypothetical protein
LYLAVPLLIAVASVARFGFGRDGLVGGGVFSRSPPALEKSTELRNGGDSFDWFF